MSDLKERLLSKFELKHVEREVEGEVVYIKQLSAAEAESYQFDRIDPHTGEVDFERVRGCRAELVAACLCDEDGNLQFTDDEVGDNFPATFVDAAYTVCAEVNGMRGELEDAEKN